MSDVVKTVVNKRPEIKYGPELMTATMMGSRVLIKQWEAEEKTKGGIILPDIAKDEAKPKRGTVVLTGPGSEDDPIKVYPGYDCIFGKYAGTEIVIDGEEYVFMSQNDIFMYWKPKN